MFFVGVVCGFAVYDFHFLCLPLFCLLFLSLPPSPPPLSLPSLSCEAGDLAGRLGPLPVNGQLNMVDTTGQIDLNGFYSIVGRSIVIHEVGTNDNFECGTIISQEELDGQLLCSDKS